MQVKKQYADRYKEYCTANEKNSFKMWQEIQLKEDYEDYEKRMKGLTMVKTKYGPVGYLLEYRGLEHPAPYVVGISQGSIMYLSKDSIFF